MSIYVADNQGPRLIVQSLETVQIALFLRSPPLDALQLWSQVIGSTPTGFQTHSPGHTEARGIDGLHEIAIITQVGVPRVDVTLQNGTPSLGAGLADAVNGIQAAIDVARKLIPLVDVGRPAVVLQGYTDAPGIVESVAEVQKMLPGVSLPPGAKEVTHQVSVTRQSTVAGRTITQLCRWQSVQVQWIAINPSVPGPAGMPARKFVAHAYVDVYVDLMEPLDTQKAEVALQEVVDVAQGIFERGYNELF